MFPTDVRKLETALEAAAEDFRTASLETLGKASSSIRILVLRLSEAGGSEEGLYILKDLIASGVPHRESIYSKAATLALLSNDLSEPARTLQLLTQEMAVGENVPTGRNDKRAARLELFRAVSAFSAAVRILDDRSNLPSSEVCEQLNRICIRWRQLAEIDPEMQYQDSTKNSVISGASRIAGRGDLMPSEVNYFIHCPPVTFTAGREETYQPGGKPSPFWDHGKPRDRKDDIRDRGNPRLRIRNPDHASFTSRRTQRP